MFDTESPLKIKWQPEHFPQGTVVRVNLPSGTERNAVEYEVQGLYRNAPQNYVIKTNVPSTIEGMTETFALCYVVEVIKRGDGPVVFCNVKNPGHWRKNYEAELRGFRTGQARWGVTAKIHAKTHYHFVSGHDIIYYLMEKAGLFDKNTTLDMSEMAGTMMEQSFVHFHRSAPSYHFPQGSVIAISASKKRLNRWFKQNYNRFLVTNRSAEMEQQKLYSDMCDEDYHNHNPIDEDIEDGEDLRDGEAGSYDPASVEPPLVMLEDIDNLSDISPESTRALLNTPVPGRVRPDVAGLRKLVDAFSEVSRNASVESDSSGGTGRYSIGQKLIGVALAYWMPDKEVEYNNVVLFRLHHATGLKFMELTVTEHHKVSTQNDITDELNCDGYKLVNNDDYVWLNQYPKASYEKGSDSNDRMFTREHFQLPADRVWLLTDQLDQLYLMIEVQEEMTQSKTDFVGSSNIHDKAWLKELLRVKDMIENEFHKQFPDKQLIRQPVIPGYDVVLGSVIVDR